jgi:hypothetical protein
LAQVIFFLYTMEPIIQSVAGLRNRNIKKLRFFQRNFLFFPFKLEIIEGEKNCAFIISCQEHQTMSCNTANEEKKYLSTVHDSIETLGSVTFTVDEVIFLLQMKDFIIFCIFRNILSPSPRGRLFSAVCIRRSTQAWKRFLTKLTMLLRQAYASQSYGGHSQETYSDLPNTCEVNPVSCAQDDYHWKEESWWL